MDKNKFHELVASRLEDLAGQVEYLLQQKDFATADLLREEGLHLAEAFDNEELFLFLTDHASL